MKNEKIMKAYKALKGMETAQDLRRNRLTLSDFHAAWDTLKAAYIHGRWARTVISSVAAWFDRMAFSVSLGETGVGYYIHD